MRCGRPNLACRRARVAIAGSGTGSNLAIKTPLHALPAATAATCSVTIRRTSNSTTGAVLNLAEVQLFDASGTRIPRTQLTASLSSVYVQSGVPWTADRCLDDDSTTVCSTNVSDPDPWLTIGYPCSARLSRVVGVNRNDCCANRILDFSLSVLNSTGARLWPDFRFATNQAQYEIQGARCPEHQRSRVAPAPRHSPPRGRELTLLLPHVRAERVVVTIGTKSVALYPSWPLNHTAARAQCQADGGELVTLTTAAEQQAYFDAMNARAPAANGSWIGLYSPIVSTDRTYYRWLSTGSANVYKPWASGQPDNSGGAEGQFVQLLFGTNTWNDVPVSTPLPFGCQIGELPLCACLRLAPAPCAWV